jgi:hypothetical protein
MVAGIRGICMATADQTHSPWIVCRYRSGGTDFRHGDVRRCCTPQVITDATGPMHNHETLSGPVHDRTPPTQRLGPSHQARQGSQGQHQGLTRQATANFYNYFQTRRLLGACCAYRSDGTNQSAAGTALILHIGAHSCRAGLKSSRSSQQNWLIRACGVRIMCARFTGTEAHGAVQSGGAVVTYGGSPSSQLDHMGVVRHCIAHVKFPPTIQSSQVPRLWRYAFQYRCFQYLPAQVPRRVGPASGF